MIYKFHFGDTVKINQPDSFYHGAIGNVILCKGTTYLVDLQYGGSRVSCPESDLESYGYAIYNPPFDPGPVDPFEEYLKNPASLKRFLKILKEAFIDEDWKHLNDGD